MMPGVRNEFREDSVADVNSPIIPLEEGLTLSELLKTHQTEFVIRPEDDYENDNCISPESCFDFESLMKAANLDVCDVDEEDGENGTPFDKYRRKMQDLRADGKVKKHISRQGMGSLVPDNCIVYIRYQAYAEYAEMPFDSTLWQCNGEGDIPVPFNLSKGQLLPGLHEAILSMKKGEKAEFLIHPDLAYGKFGCEPRIPANATVLFIVEVDRFVDCGEAFNAEDDLSHEERIQFCNVYKTAKSSYMMANDLFSRENYFAAVKKYRQVINMMHNARLADEKEEKDRNHFLIKNYTNACICYNKLRKYKAVCLMAQDAIRVDEKEALQNGKLLYFFGVAKTRLGDFDGAKKHLLAAKKRMPTNSDIAAALKELEMKKNEALQQERLMMMKAFGQQPPSQAKITELDESEIALRETISEQLKDFKTNQNKDRLVIKDNFSSEEEKIYLQIAKDLGLYARIADIEKRVIEIKKPLEM